VAEQIAQGMEGLVVPRYGTRFCRLSGPVSLPADQMRSQRGTPFNPTNGRMIPGFGAGDHRAILIGRKDKGKYHRNSSTQSTPQHAGTRGSRWILPSCRGDARWPLSQPSTDACGQATRAPRGASSLAAVLEEAVFAKALKPNQEPKNLSTRFLQRIPSASLSRVSGMTAKWWSRGQILFW